MQTKIDKVLRQVGSYFKANNLKLATAESCTAGGLSYYLANQPKFSGLLERGFITYSHEAKKDLLNVKCETLLTHGAVSKQVAIEMAMGALKNSRAQMSISITGIAGPDKSLSSCNAESGIVWIACVDTHFRTHCIQKYIPGSRKTFCKQVIWQALTELNNFINPNSKESKL